MDSNFWRVSAILAAAILTQSWAIKPGEEKPDFGVSDACAKQLSKET